MSESQIVNACLDLIKYKYKDILSWRNNSGAFRTKHGGFYKFGTKGSPDIIAVYGGQFIGIECKMPKGKQTKSQKDFQKELEKVGGIYWLIYSSEELENKIQTFIGC